MSLIILFQNTVESFMLLLRNFSVANVCLIASKQLKFHKKRNRPLFHLKNIYIFKEQPNMALFTLHHKTLIKV